MSLVVMRPPQTDDELWWYVYALWNIKIPRHRICDNHVSPFEAFADAYFARDPVAIWKASRGFGGKSTLLATLIGTEAVALAVTVALLGGSGAQSQRVHDTTKEMWEQPLAPSALLGNATMYKTHLTNGAWITALLASQRSVRGLHPIRLRLDEIDEMDQNILESAQGMPQEDVRKHPGIDPHTVMSSTHQYPDKAMSAMLERAEEKDWPVYEWCWRESMGTEDEPGWLTQRMVDRKRKEVSHAMWDMEYDLQEPSFEGRAIEVEFVDAMFNKSLGEYEGAASRQVVIEEPIDGATYVTGIDWAKESDWTIMWTWRTDVRPWKAVAFYRVGRMPWPYIINQANLRMQKYGGLLAHDGTGIGTVIDDYLEYDRRYVEDVTLMGRTRETVINDYIAGIENRELESPHIRYAYGEHKYVTLEDLFGKGHMPDTFSAGSLAWYVRNKQQVPFHIKSITRPEGESPWSLASTK